MYTKYIKLVNISAIDTSGFVLKTQLKTNKNEIPDVL